MKKRISILFLLILLLSPYASAYSPKITGIIHYRSGFLVLTEGPTNNTTQLWFFEPEKGLNLLNATFPDLTFIHSTGKRVLLYRNLPKGPYLQDFELYLYNGTLHFLGNYSERDNWGVGSRIYWNGRFYLFLEADWSTQRGDYYNWYAIVGDEIHKVFPPNLESSLLFSGVWESPYGYLLKGEDPMSYQNELFFLGLNASKPLFLNLTPENLSVGKLCFNGTHFAALDSNWFKVIFCNCSTWRYYLQIIDLSGESRLIPLDSFSGDEKDIYFEFLGSHDGVWVVRKFKYWCNKSEDGSLKCHERTLRYFIISPNGITKVRDIGNLTAVCVERKAQPIFGGERPKGITPTLRGRSVTINGTLLKYGGKTFKLPFNVTMIDCGNGCLLSNGDRMAYFNGTAVKLITLPQERKNLQWPSLLGITFILLLLAGLLKRR